MKLKLIGIAIIVVMSSAAAHAGTYYDRATGQTIDLVTGHPVKRYIIIPTPTYPTTITRTCQRYGGNSQCVTNYQ